MSALGRWQESESILSHPEQRVCLSRELSNTRRTVTCDARRTSRGSFAGRPHSKAVPSWSTYTRQRSALSPPWHKHRFPETCFRDRWPQTFLVGGWKSPWTLKDPPSLAFFWVHSSGFSRCVHPRRTMRHDDNQQKHSRSVHRLNFEPKWMGRSFGSGTVPKTTVASVFSTMMR